MWRRQELRPALWPVLRPLDLENHGGCQHCECGGVLVDANGLRFGDCADCHFYRGHHCAGRHSPQDRHLRHHNAQGQSLSQACHRGLGESRHNHKRIYIRPVSVWGDGAASFKWALTRLSAWRVQVADDSGNFTARWSLISGSLRDGVSLTSVARTPLVKWASEAEAVTSFSFPLVLLAGSLSPKTSYVFTLSSVNNQVGTTQALLRHTLSYRPCHSSSAS
jgi:hypothetical protein